MKMQLLWKPIICCGGKIMGFSKPAIAASSLFRMPVWWPGCRAVPLPGIFLWEQVSWQSRAGSSLAWLCNRSRCSFCRHTVAVSSQVLPSWNPQDAFSALGSAVPACQPFSWRTHSPCWQTCHTLLEATLTSLALLTIFHCLEGHTNTLCLQEMWEAFWALVIH